MRITSILRAAQGALRSEKGRRTGRSVTDKVAGQARKVAGDKHASKIDSAQQAAHDYIDKQGGRGTGEPGSGPPPRG
ncbi:antitoxin [Ruania suaedae]|uniref:antitoxin n=1 Tax=Ruania suaedae TaxID=2897774 RepID=UPI001E2A5743|nr:antitoxin [Ruania suaedae]UFU02867.1 antitoxin [Ruania suaedae]